MASLAAPGATTRARIGPVHGVQPKANAKPRREPLRTPGCVVQPRRWPSRRTQRDNAGPKKPLTGTGEEGTAARPARKAAAREASVIYIFISLRYGHDNSHLRFCGSFAQKSPLRKKRR